MQELTHNNPIIPVQSNIAWMMSLITLIIVILACLGLWGYQFVMRDQVATLTTDISSIEQTLALARSDKAVIIADILSSATIRPSIPLKEIVRAFRVAAMTAGVRLQ